MKGLKQYMNFDLQAFLAEKNLTVVGSRNYEEHETKKHLGITVDCIITQDRTQYVFKDKPFTNLYEKISLKVTKDVTVAIGDIVEPVGDIKATVWGDYNNNLSVVCSDIKVLEAEPSKPVSQGNNKTSLPNLN